MDGSGRVVEDEFLAVAVHAKIIRRIIVRILEVKSAKTTINYFKHIQFIHKQMM